MIKTIPKSWFAFDKRLFFIFLCLLAVLLSMASKELLFSESLYIQAFEDQYTRLDITRFLDFQRKWQWLAYLLIPFIYLIKIALVACALSIGAFINEWDFSFSRFFKIALIAESVFLLPLVYKLIWFGWIHSDFSLHDLTFFYPLSLLNHFVLDTSTQWALYPLQVLNLFELMYVSALALGIQLALKYKAHQSWLLVLAYYGTGLLIWVMLVVFLTILVGT